jgi:hypothetical protein
MGPQHCEANLSTGIKRKTESGQPVDLSESNGASITNGREEKKERKGKNISPRRRKQGKWNRGTWKNEHGGRRPSGKRGGSWKAVYE